MSRDDDALEKKNAILNQFDELQQNLSSIKPPDLKNFLLNLKEAIFEYTGGHSMLYEISKIIQELKSENNFVSSTPNVFIEETSWIKSK